jgi:hypothetical protein
MTRYLLLFDSYGLDLWGALSDEKTGLSFVYAAGLCQRRLTAYFELFVIYPRGGPHGKYSLMLSSIVLSVFTDPLPSNRRPIVKRLGSRGNVFTDSFSSNGSVRKNMHNPVRSSSGDFVTGLSN